MNLIRQFAGCGAVMLVIVWSGWAAEQAGGQPALRSLGEAGKSEVSLPCDLSTIALAKEEALAKQGDQLIPATAADGTNSSSVACPPERSGVGGSVLCPPASAPGATAGRPAPFSAEISADFMKKVMETSAKIEAAKRQIAERQAQLYTTNPEIKSTRAQMIEGQKEINRILDADPELAELKMSRDILLSTMPALPKGQNPASMPRMPVAR